jgi:hypothetical protein
LAAAESAVAVAVAAAVLVAVGGGGEVAWASGGTFHCDQVVETDVAHWRALHLDLKRAGIDGGPFGRASVRLTVAQRYAAARPISEPRDRAGAGGVLLFGWAVTRASTAVHGAPTMRLAAMCDRAPALERLPA